MTCGARLPLGFDTDVRSGVIRVDLTVDQPVLVYSQQPTSSDRPGWLR
jgi:hypothetical protein